MAEASWKIEWSDALSMSNPEIDAEHQRFIALLNELNGAIIGGHHDNADIERIMNVLLGDAIAHFSHEERLFVEKGYPAAQAHTQIHSAIISKFKQTLKQIHDSEFSNGWIERVLTIKNLLINHILIDDTKYSEYLRTGPHPIQ